MATPNFEFYRDWIMHILGEVSRWVTDVEISASMAEINREILNDVGFRESVSTDDITFSATNLYATLPSNALTVERVSIVEDDVTRFIDVIDYRDYGLRASYADKGNSYAYSVGRKLLLSWEPTEDLTITCYHIPFSTEGTIVVSSESVDLGSNEDMISVNLGRAFRYGVIADLMNVHGRTELHEMKARRWEGIYRNLVARAQKTTRELTPAYSVHKRRNY